MTIDEMIAVLQAAKDKIASTNYQAAPEPREIWVNEYERGLGLPHVKESTARESGGFDHTFKRTIHFREVL